MFFPVNFPTNYFNILHITEICIPSITDNNIFIKKKLWNNLNFLFCRNNLFYLGLPGADDRSRRSCCAKPSGNLKILIFFHILLLEIFHNQFSKNHVFLFSRIFFSILVFLLHFIRCLTDI